MIRILYYFPELHTQMFNWQRVHILNELNYHNVEVDTFNPLEYASWDIANEQILKVASSREYNLFMTCICSEKMLYPHTLETIKRIGIPTISFRPDNLTIPYNDKSLAPLFDLIWLTSCETQGIYDKWGARSIFLPYAANPLTFKYIPSPIIRKVCFIGTPYGSRSIMINNLTNSKVAVDAFCKPRPKPELGYSLTDKKIKQNIILPSTKEVVLSNLKYPEGRKILIGSLINKIKGSTSLLQNNYLVQKQFVPVNDLSANYSQYTLCLSSTSNRNTDVLKNPVKIINLRSFEIPMSGGVALCKYNPELAEYFEDGKEIIFYNDNEELVDKAKYYIERAHDREIISIKCAARSRAESEHTWWNRFTKLFDELGLKYE